MSSPTAVKSCLDVLRRTDPRDAEKHLSALAGLVVYAHVEDELYQRVDVPLRVGEDPLASGRKFLLCEHNRDGDSHRSPWSNSYLPPLDDDNGLCPPERLRDLELHANEVFDIYRGIYYGKASSVSSVYLWEKDVGDGGGRGDDHAESPGFAGCFLIQNQIDEGNYWNSIHVVDIGRAQKGKCLYRLTTTILISVTPFLPGGQGVEEQSKHSTNVSGSLTRARSRECELGDDAGHIPNIGSLIEDAEGDMRSEIDSLYIQKTRSVVEMMRQERGPKSPLATSEGREHTKVLNEAVLAAAMNRKASLK